MFETAVICTDLTDTSDNLVGCAGELGVLGVRNAVLTHVVDVFSEKFASEGFTRDEEDLYLKQLAFLDGSGMSVHVEAPLGHPAFSLEEVRRRHNAQLIVVGPHNRGLYSVPFSGSVSSDLIRLSGSPVLITSPRPAFGEESRRAQLGMLSDVLVCTDLGDSTRRLLEVTEGLMRVGAARVTLLHVQDLARFAHSGPDFEPEHERADAVQMARHRDMLNSDPRSSVEIEVTYGSAPVELSRRARSGEYSLIVLGSSGSCSQEEHVSVKDSVVRSATIPVMIVPTR